MTQVIKNGVDTYEKLNFVYPFSVTKSGETATVGTQDNLNDIAVITSPAEDSFIQYKTSAFVERTLTQVKHDLQFPQILLAKMASLGSTSNNSGGTTFFANAETALPQFLYFYPTHKILLGNLNVKCSGFIGVYNPSWWWTVTVYKNAIATALSVTLTMDSASGQNNTDWITVEPTDYIAIYRSSNITQSGVSAQNAAISALAYTQYV